MEQLRVVLLPGDGIGPEITAVARELLEVVSARFNFSLTFDEQLIGGVAIDATGEPLPASTLKVPKAALVPTLNNTIFDAMRLDATKVF